MSKLLINENPLIVLPSLAVALQSINAAIVIQQIHYWINDQRAPFRDGHRWHYATFDSWLKQFPWVSVRTLKSIIAFLEEKGLIISKEFNRLKGDRTKWYTIDYDVLSSLEIPPNTHSAKVALPSGKSCTTIVQELHDVYKEEETNKETTKENNKQATSHETKNITLEKDAAVVCFEEGILEHLIGYGVNKNTGKAWIEKYGASAIENKLRMLVDELSKGTATHNAAGWLNKALEENWKPAEVKKGNRPYLTEKETQDMLNRLSNYQKPSDEVVNIHRGKIKKLVGKEVCK